MTEPTWNLSDKTSPSGRALFDCSGCGDVQAAPEKTHICAAKRTKRLSLDPDLGDGQHWTIHDRPDVVLLEYIAQWMAEAMPGEEITIKLVEMTDAQADALPDI